MRPYYVTFQVLPIVPRLLALVFVIDAYTGIGYLYDRLSPHHSRQADSTHEFWFVRFIR